MFMQGDAMNTVHRYGVNEGTSGNLQEARYGMAQLWLPPIMCGGDGTIKWLYNTKRNLKVEYGDTKTGYG